MSLTRYAVPIRLDLKPSKILAWFFVSMHLGAIGIVVFLPFDRIVAILIVLCVFASLVRLVYEIVWLKKSTSIVSLVCDNESEWQLIQRDGQLISVGLLPTSVVHPWLTVLRFQTSRWWCRKSVVIVSDRLSVDAFRRLRVHLKVTKLSEEV